MLNKRWAGGCNADRESWGGRHRRQEESRWEQGGRGGSAGEKGRSHRAGRLGREQTAVPERSHYEDREGSSNHWVKLLPLWNSVPCATSVLQGFLVCVMKPLSLSV